MVKVNDLLSLVKDDSIMLSEDQEVAVRNILNFLHNRTPEDNIFTRMSGFAGCGKTTVISYLLKHATLLFPPSVMEKKIAVCTFTWKAAMVLRSKGFEEARSIHSIFYSYPDEVMTKNGKKELYFRKLPPELLRQIYGLIIVDEASMVDSQMRCDLEACGIPIIYVGDAGQLPPIKGDGKFISESESLLTNIHRQAHGNPIIEASLLIREGKQLPFGELIKGDPRFIRLESLDDLTDEMLLDADQIIVGRNDTRNKINRYVRKLKNINPRDYPHKGEKLIGLNNIKSEGLFNGYQWTCADSTFKGYSIHDATSHQISIIDETNILKTPDVIFDNSIIFDEMDSATKSKYLFDGRLYLIDFAYAITCHKAQGSQFKKIVVINEPVGDRKRWLYTAITRASDEVILVG